ncbi:MAG: hypothetical protein COB51_14480 [Moraxellaceae bacterium]|nr:MAG: hypothetical protein COB51_14480 [Moraxellaceae bacterium]
MIFIFQIEPFRFHLSNLFLVPEKLSILVGQAQTYRFNKLISMHQFYVSHPKTKRRWGIYIGIQTVRGSNKTVRAKIIAISFIFWATFSLQKIIKHNEIESNTEDRYIITLLIDEEH